MSKAMYTKERNLELLEVSEALTHLATAGCKCDIDRALDVDMVRISGSARNVLNGLCAISTPELLSNQGDIDRYKQEMGEKDQEIASLREQLAAAQNDVKQLRQSRDKRATGCAARDDGVVMAALAEMRGMIERMQQGGEVVRVAQDDGWIEWKGGECPVDPYTHVSCKLQDGKTMSGVASGFYWGVGSSWGGQIIAYRLAK